MKKRDLATLAMIGISAGLMAGGCQKYGSSHKGSAQEVSSPDMTAFQQSLSQESQAKFKQLDAQHKMMAIEMANQKCNGKNKCSSMGGCETSEHACAGQNGCKGQGGAPIKDPSKAVEVQYKNQMARQAQLQQQQ